MITAKVFYQLGHNNRKDCEHPRKTDLTHGLGDVRNIYCLHCGMHEYRGRTWTREEWNKYVNDLSEDVQKYYKETVDGIEYNTVQVRPDLLKAKESVPVGDGFYGKEQRLPYRWFNEDEDFQVYLDGKWQEAESIDFDFDFSPITKK